MKKVVIITVLAVVAVVALTIVSAAFLGMLAGGMIPFAPTYDRVDRALRANVDDLTFVVEALFEIDHNSVEIRINPFTLPEEEKYSMSFSDGLGRESMPIPVEMLEPIERLHKSGILVILRGRDSARFSLWSSLSESRGMIYSRTGETPWSPQLIEVRQLSEENWYFYVNNFEKARARNPHLFQ